MDDFYNGIIDKFYAQEKMKREFSKDESHFAMEGKVDMQRLMLNRCDLWLEKLPADSLLIVHEDSAADYFDDHPEEAKNVLSIVFGNSKIALVHVWFDELTVKIIGIMAVTLLEADRKILLEY